MLRHAHLTLVDEQGTHIIRGGKIHLIGRKALLEVTMHDSGIETRRPASD
ncbi:hypothetical protein QCK34_004555 [Enterobacter asburiae]|nr:hypothetical protein [Enterobacter asburiae]